MTNCSLLVGSLLPFLCALCIGRRKRELAAYMTWIENKFKVLESRGKSADRSKLVRLSLLTSLCLFSISTC
jgi:hypothetical protein